MIETKSNTTPPNKGSMALTENQRPARYAGVRVGAYNTVAYELLTESAA